MTETDEQSKLKSLFEGDKRPSKLAIGLAIFFCSLASVLSTQVYDHFQDEIQVNQKYNEWKSGLTPERRAWEETIEKSMGDFYWYRYKRDRVRGRVTCWDFGEVNPSLPTVFIIGDSISLGYTPGVRSGLKEIANVRRAPENCGKAAYGLTRLDKWLGKDRYKLIYFNFGIHDSRTDTKSYAESLQKVVERLKQNADLLVFATSTPLPEDPDKKLSNKDIVEKNEAAIAVMKKNGVLIDDLYGFVEPQKDRLLEPNDCHFRMVGYQELGKHVTATIQNILSAQNRRKRSAGGGEGQVGKI